MSDENLLNEKETEQINAGRAIIIQEKNKKDKKSNNKSSIDYFEKIAK